MAKRIIRTCELIMEICWLLALVSIPIYFNIYTSRVFEPDKITLFRSLVLVMVVAWLSKGIARLAIDWQAAQPTGPGGVRKNRAAPVEEIIYPADGEVVGPDERPFPQNVIRRPLMPFAFVLAFVYLITTVFSIVPGISWWGSYQRLQGTYTFLSYFIFFLVIVFNMRERRQLERLISFVLLGNIPVALYGLLQHYKADPLQWQGDVVLRVTSTMGNAIFISAYLIMVAPLVLYRAMTTGQWLLRNRAQAGKYLRGRQRDTALSWVTLYACFLVFLVGVFFVVLNFNANYRPDSTPGVAQASDAAQLLGNDSAAAEARSLIGNGSVGPWWALPIGIVISFSLFFLFTVRRRGTDSNYLFRLFEFGGYLTLLVIVFLTIFYSQSRGPEVGVLVGVFVFFPLIFWRRKLWKWLIGWLAVGLVAAGILVLFNLPAGTTPLEPIFKVVRQNEQIARLGTIFNANDGTGQVRQLIWKTVLEAMGDAAKNEPARLLVGYGPESLYNVSPRHYQPELAHIEARNAIPDRSHNGYLDALVTTGVVGLAAYIALVVAFLFYAVRFLRRTERFEYQVLLAALISIMIAHQIEIQTGIQIVSTWMMFWTSGAILLVTGGLIYGRWDMIGAKAALVETTLPVEEPAPAPIEEAEPVLTTNNKVGKKNAKAVAVPIPTVVAEAEPELVARSVKKGQSSKDTKNKEAVVNGRTKTSLNASRAKEREQGGSVVRNAPVIPTRPGRKAGPIIANAFTEPEYVGGSRPVKGWFWAGVGVLAIIALIYAWLGNLLPILGDTVYKQGSNLGQVSQWTRATPYLEEASILSPNEDFYSLYLGQAYLEIAQSQAKDKVKLEYYLNKSEAELLRANKLAPLNPDHYANLARLYTRWADLEPERANEMLTKSVQRYQQVVTNYAPRNARLWAEYAAAEASLATRGQDTSIVGGTNTLDKPHKDKAIEAGLASVKLDSTYDFNRLVLGDVYRFAGQTDDAGVQYAALAGIDSHQLAVDERYALRMQNLAASKGVGPGQAVSDLAASRKTFVLAPAVAMAYDKAGLDPVKLQPATEQAATYTARGMVQFYQNSFEAARVSLTNGSKLDTNDPYSHTYLSLIYKRLGQPTQAQNEAAQARAIAGQSQAANKANLQATIEQLLNS